VTRKKPLTNPLIVHNENRPQERDEATPAGDASDPVPLPGPLATGPAVHPSEGHSVPPLPNGPTMRKRAAALKRERAAVNRQAAEYIGGSGFGPSKEDAERRIAHRVVALILDEFALIDERMDKGE